MAAALTVGCGGRVILDSLSFSFPARRATCIVGPGGSGKSTLLRTLAAGGRPAPPLWTTGDVRVAPGVAMCPQRRGEAVPTVGHLLAAGGRRASRAATVARAWPAAPEAAELLLRAQDQPLTDTPPDVRRLAEITLVLASGADLLLLDEPDTGASPLTLEWLMAQLAETKTRRSLVITTHHLGLARRVADEVLLLLDGTIVEHSPVEAFFERPATARTASYVLMGS